MKITIKDTIELAIKYHGDQKDKMGNPYVRHLISVVSNLIPSNDTLASKGNDDLIHVAMLHDILEDTDMTATRLEELGYKESIIIAIEMLSRPDDISYLEYIFRIKNSNNQFAIKVKKADLITNLANISDLPSNTVFTDNDNIFTRTNRYRAALAILSI